MCKVKALAEIFPPFLTFTGSLRCESSRVIEGQLIELQAFTGMFGDISVVSFTQHLALSASLSYFSWSPENVQEVR